MIFIYMNEYGFYFKSWDTFPCNVDFFIFILHI